MAVKYKIVHYLNQFFGQIGGEDSAYQEPIYKKGPVGPGVFLNSELKDADIIGTVICGDNYASENVQELIQFVHQVVLNEKPDILIAGPAFNSGRYGLACSNVCKSVKLKFNISCLTGLYKENPAVDLFRSDIDILKTKSNVAGMKEAVQHISLILTKYEKGIAFSDVDPKILFSRGRLKNIIDANNASFRAIQIIKSLLDGHEVETEINFPNRTRQKKAILAKNLSESEIALVTDGGLVPAGNPDRLETRGASKFVCYNINELDHLDRNLWSVVHEGYDNQYVLQDPNRLVPLDALRHFEKIGKIKKIHHNLISTTGVATALAACKTMGRDIGEFLVKHNVDAVILTST